MGEWPANGAQLGWLIDPEVRTVEIYRTGFEAETIGGVPSVAGQGPARGIRAGSRAGSGSSAGLAAASPNRVFYRSNSFRNVAYTKGYGVPGG